MLMSENNLNMDRGLPGDGTDTTRLWVSDNQWLSILERVERGEDQVPDTAGGAGKATGKRAHDRHAVAFRCVIRLAPPDQPDADHGTYLVNSRNISPGGIGFLHDAQLHAGTRCTVALQPPEGKGYIIPGKVAWSRPVTREAEDPISYEVGVQFDRPVDIDPFIPAA